MAPVFRICDMRIRYARVCSIDPGRVTREAQDLQTGLLAAGIRFSHSH